jgi:GTPase SAR1 family protein
MDFEDKIRQQLKGLNKKQLCLFSWLCGLRALPFLAFADWPKNNTQKNLYRIFYALDVVAQVAFLGDFTFVTDAATNANTIDHVTKAVANATRVAEYVIRTNIDNTARVALHSFADADTRVAEYAITYASVAAAVNTADAAASSVDMKGLLLNDIKAIRQNKLGDCSHDTGIYGNIWDTFQMALKATSCDYWARFYENLFNNGFDIDKIQLKLRLGVPDEIKDQGAAEVGRYLERLGEAERLNEARIIILGEKGAGKTSIAKKLLDINAEMPKEEDSTEGVTTSLWSFKDRDGAIVNTHIWDFAGHSITHSAHRCFMSARCLYIYVYNGRIERDNDPTYWLEQIRIHGGDSPVLFLINEKDEHEANIAEKTLQNEYPSIAGYYRVDIGNEDKTELEKFCQTVMDMVCNNPSWNRQLVSTEAYKIKSELRKCFDKEKSPHITREEFNKIAKNCGAQPEHIEDILKDLHTLGICLWYDKDEMEDFNALVLNPDWITNGIYRIINMNKGKGSKKHEHILTIAKGVELLQNDKRYKYPDDKVAYLFKLMRLYELAFFKSIDNIFIPGILPIDRPSGLPTFDDVNDRLRMDFVVEKALPSNIVARVMVQRCNEIFNENLLWRKGAALNKKDSEAIALIIEEERKIIVSVKGKDKTSYITSLRETIKSIFDSYQVIKPDLLYEVLIPEPPQIPKKNIEELFDHYYIPPMVKEAILHSHLEKGQPYLDPEYAYIPLDKTGQGYGITINNIYANSVTIQTGPGSTIHSTTFIFHNCTINLQDKLKTLANMLQEGKKEPDEDAKKLLQAAKEMEQMRQLVPVDVIELSTEIKNKIEKEGILIRLKSIVKDIFDENSDLRKKLSKAIGGIQTALEIAEKIIGIVKLLSPT